MTGSKPVVSATVSHIRATRVRTRSRTSLSPQAAKPCNWLEFGGTELDPNDAKQVAATAAVELEASRRDPYRQLSRVFHLVGRKGA